MRSTLGKFHDNSELFPYEVIFPLCHTQNKLDKVQIPISSHCSFILNHEYGSCFFFFKYQLENCTVIFRTCCAIFHHFFLSHVVKRSFYKIQWLIPKNCMQNSNWVVQLKNTKCRNTTVFTLASFLPIYLIHTICYTSQILIVTKLTFKFKPTGEMKEKHLSLLKLAI